MADDSPDDRSLLTALRSRTAEIHRRIETKADIVVRLSDPLRARRMTERYAGLQLPADEVLNRHLGHIDDLDMPARRRGRLWRTPPSPAGLPAFPEPSGLVQALGMLYVIEGATLGGRIIRRELAARGIDPDDFAFLDPYGNETGPMWKKFVRVAEREAGRTRKQREDACEGALKAFRHAETLLCGE